MVRLSGFSDKRMVSVAICAGAYCDLGNFMRRNIVSEWENRPEIAGQGLEKQATNTLQ